MEGQHVLVINSYHPQYKWTARLVEGVQDGLRGVVPEENLHIEYMDERRFVDDPIYEQLLTELYRHKYANFKPSVILTSDDAAFRYLLDHRDDVFPDTPVVFCGVNVFEAALLEGRRGYTGILEGMEIAGNIELIKSVHPAVERIIMLGDQTSFGARMGSQARRVMADHADGPDAERVRLELWDDFALPDLYDEVSALDDDTVLLLLAIHKDNAGNYFSFAEQLPILSERSAVPIYGMWGALLLGQGILGGQLNDPYLHGQNTAAVAARVLEGEDPDAIPILEKAIYLPAFDYQQMLRFGISERALPDGARVELRPITFYSQYRQLVWLTLGLVGFLIGVIATLLVNTTRRRRAEESLRESEQKLSLHVQRSSLGFIEWDYDLKVTGWNPAAESIFGLTDKAAIGQYMLDLFPELDCLDDEAYLEGMGRERTAAEHLRSDGERVLCEWFHTPLVSSSGAVIGLASMLEDVTERKQLEAQLLQSQKMEAVGRLAGGIAHDFNNILTGILGNLELAQLQLLPGDPVTPKALTGLQWVWEGGMRAARLTRQLLVFSRKDVVSIEVVDICAVPRDLLGMLRRLISEEISLELDLPDTPLYARLDKGQFEQILMNLVVNASDAMPDGGVLSLRAEPVAAGEARLVAPPQARGGAYVRVTVTDTGSGMSEETLKRACEPFFTTKPPGEGTGLGLSTVFGLVTKWGGHLHIDSAPGRGTSVEIYLPATDTAPIEPAAQPRAQPSLGGTESILLCEDDPHIKEMLTQMLTAHGYTVLQASNGEDALALAAGYPHTIHMLLSDVVMPKMGGWELAEQLEARVPGIKTLFISGYAEDVLSRHGERVSGVTLLMKPFGRVDLLNRVREVLDR